MKRVLMVLVCGVLLVSSPAFAGSFADYTVSVPERANGIEVAQNGVVGVSVAPMVVYVKPKNDQEIGRGRNRFFKHDEYFEYETGKFLTGLFYRYERMYASQFVVTVIVLKPAATSAIVDLRGITVVPANGQVVVPVKACRVDLVRTVRDGVRDEFQRPIGTAGLSLFSIDEATNALSKNEIPVAGVEIDKNMGFVLYYDCPTPVPGTDTFEVVVGGLTVDAAVQPEARINYTATTRCRVWY